MLFAHLENLLWSSVAYTQWPLTRLTCLKPAMACLSWRPGPLLEPRFTNLTGSSMDLLSGRHAYLQLAMRFITQKYVRCCKLQSHCSHTFFSKMWLVLQPFFLLVRTSPEPMRCAVWITFYLVYFPLFSIIFICSNETLHETSLT